MDPEAIQTNLELIYVVMTAFGCARGGTPFGLATKGQRVKLVLTKHGRVEAKGLGNLDAFRIALGVVDDARTVGPLL